MPIYNHKLHVQTYVFSELFENDPAWDGNTYANKYLAFAKAITDLSDDLLVIPTPPGFSAESNQLLDMLYRKYAFSHIRYTNGIAFLVQLFRVLHCAWPRYVEQEALVAQMRAMAIADIQRESKSIRNLINNPNDPTATPDETPIPNLSTEQETLLNQSSAFSAMLNKFDAIRKEADRAFFKELDPFFTQILSEDDVTIYPAP